MCMVNNCMKQQTCLVKKHSFLSNLRKYRTLLLMLMPSLILVIIFSYLPMGGLLLAFKRFRYSDGIFGSPWVGFDNFIFFFMSGKAFQVARNTALYNIAFIAVNTFLEVSFAVILSEMLCKWLKKLTQSIIFLPFFISWVIVGSISFSLLSYEVGTVNKLLVSLGLDRVNFYSEGKWWPFIIIAFSAWKSVGYGMVLYLASIVGIDTTMYEAAEIDGANIFQRTWHITLPALTPTVITLTLLALGRVFRGNLDMFYQLIGQNGALFNATDVIDTYVFRMTIAASDIGQTVAIGLFQSVLCFVTIMIANYLVKVKNDSYALF